MVHQERDFAREARVELEAGFSLYGGSNRFGNPIRYDMEDVEEAAGFLDRRLSTGWLVRRNIGPTIRATSLYRNRNQLRGFVRLEAGENNVVVPVPPMNHHLFIDHRHHETPVDRRVDLDLCAVVTDGDDGLLSKFSRSNVYARHRNPDTTMDFYVRAEHGLDRQAIAAGLEVVFERTSQFVGAVLLGEVNPPYAYKYLAAQPAA